MPSRPYFKFYPNDWLGDGKLRGASLAARGLWLEMIISMHAADPVGHLVIGLRAFTESKRDVEDLGILLGFTDRRATRDAFAELKSRGVYSTTEDGVIYCRGIVRRAEKERKASAAGKHGGGNPRLKIPLKVGPKGELYTDYDEGVYTTRGRESIVQRVTSLPTVETPPSASAPPRSQRLRLRTDAEATADEAIALLAERIRPALHGMTWATWRKFNRKHVVNMAESGMTAAEIDAEHIAQSDDFGEIIVSMAMLQKRISMPKRDGKSPQKTDEPRHRTRAEILRAEAESARV